MHIEPFLFILIVQSVHCWDGHDITTLKLLQVVHRHGDRTPNSFVPNDPYKSWEQFWPEGKAELTKQGRNRMYKIGQFIRKEYKDFLGDTYSPREVYARSSHSSRVLESVALVLAGLYPPSNKNWQWGDSELGRLWQPIPIETVMPKKKDNVLTVKMKCPKADKAVEDFYASEVVTKALDDNKEFLKNMSQLFGEEVTLKLAKTMVTTLSIERSRGLYWSDQKNATTSRQFDDLIYQKLRPLSDLHWNGFWADEVIKRIRGGPLVEELVNNMLAYIQGKPKVNSLGKPYKVMVYGTHDAKLAALMNAMDIFNKQHIPFGATLLFELHQMPDVNDFFVTIYYHNETHPNDTSNARPYELRMAGCSLLNQCSLDKLKMFTQKVIPDWDEECSSGTTTLVINNLLILSICLVKFLFCTYAKRITFKNVIS